VRARKPVEAKVSEVAEARRREEARSVARIALVDARAESHTDVFAALRLFTIEGLAHEDQKRLLRKAKLIEYAHGLWCLSVEGVRQAVRLGYLEP
jgi:hypothetical protein